MQEFLPYISVLRCHTEHAEVFRPRMDHQQGNYIKLSLLLHRAFRRITLIIKPTNALI